MVLSIQLLVRFLLLGWGISRQIITNTYSSRETSHYRPDIGQIAPRGCSVLVRRSPHTAIIQFRPFSPFSNKKKVAALPSILLRQSVSQRRQYRGSFPTSSSRTGSGVCRRCFRVIPVYARSVLLIRPSTSRRFRSDISRQASELSMGSPVCRSIAASIISSIVSFSTLGSLDMSRSSSLYYL